MRFNELKQAVGEIPPRTLAQRLVELEAAGVLRAARDRFALAARGVPADQDGRRLQVVIDAVVHVAFR